MKKIIRLTESELNKIVEASVKRAINEGAINEYGIKDFGKDAALVGAVGATTLGGMAGNAYFNDDDYIDPEQQEINQAVEDEFGSAQGKLPNDTIGWEEAQSLRRESRIHRAIMESIRHILG